MGKMLAYELGQCQVMCQTIIAYKYKKLSLKFISFYMKKNKGMKNLFISSGKIIAVWGRIVVKKRTCPEL